MRRLDYRLAAWLLVLSCAAVARAAEPEPALEQIKFFEQKIRPILVENCYKCHGPKEQKGKLRLDLRVAVLAGGETGPALVPGKPAESLLVEAINYESYEMPPTGKLPVEQIALLTEWVRRGAPMPNDPEGGGHIIKPARGEFTPEDRQWWAFQPVQNPPVPPISKGSTWGMNEIDRFIHIRLNQAGLSPAGEADPAILIRRLSYDLTGLPPTPEDVAAFVRDFSLSLPLSVSPSSGKDGEKERKREGERAYETLVDKLLASPRYGERWARLWLDLVRYADSDGYRIDDFRPNAWRYRDYVIRSFNSDKPYDRFVQEQLAGDELFPGDPDALTATGYLRHWIYEYNSRDVRGQWQIILDDITDTTGDVFLGLGMQCAKCHDHKFDPILQKDYYRLQAFFAGILPQDNLLAATESQIASHAPAQAAWEAKTADLRKEIDAIEVRSRAGAERDAIGKFPEDIQEILHKPISDRTPLERQLGDLAYRQVYYEYDRIERKLKGEEKERWIALRKELAAFDAQKPEPLPVVMAVTDLGPEAAPVFIPKKGKEPIQPGYLSLLDPQPAEIAPLDSSRSSTGRRAALARWLTRPENPLTARVMVNRIWQQHFGRGLAANASDFGRLGEPPTHPELLDWLTTQFVSGGWRLKALHKQIVMSATYRQSAAHPDPGPGRLKDPDNRLYWRGGVRRLEAEQIRDSLYAVTGELAVDSVGGPGAASETPCRSIYLRVMRNTRNPVLEAFDAPFWINSSSSRHTTTTPVQSLLLLNSQFLLKRGEALAKRIIVDSTDDAGRIRRAYDLAFGREPTTAEIDAAIAFLNRQGGRVDVVDAASAEAKFLYDRIPFRDGQAAVVSAAQAPMTVPKSDAFPRGDFTIEAFFVLRSIFDTGSVRVVANHWAGKLTEPGWSFGVTGKGSRRKPQTLVMQMVGKNAAGNLVEEPVFSDHHIQLNKPYYVAAAVTFANKNKPGRVKFFVKDLSNDDEPLLTAEVEHELVGGAAGDMPLVIGGRSPQSDTRFDGLIDDVRLSGAALGVDQLLFTTEALGRETLGYWRFEAEPDVFADSSGKGLALLSAAAAGPKKADARQQAWIDWCHVLLNSNEFLYVP